MEFLDALKKYGNNPVIPDIKVKSPKEGDLLLGRDPAEYAIALVRAGAPVLSVVTENKNFGGSMEILKEVVKKTGVQVLRKDFISSKEDLKETKEAGASAILLMYATLPEEKINELFFEARRIGLDVLLETHSRETFEKAVRLKADLIGINNRDITILERDNGDFTKTLSLIQEYETDAFIVTESSISNGDQVRQCIKNGAGAALVGTALLKAEDPARMYHALTRKTSVKFCGITDEAGLKECMAFYPDILGFVSGYPEKVPWEISADKAAELVKLARGHVKTCLVTGGNAEHVIGVVQTVKPDIVQLHHRENIVCIKEMINALKDTGIEVIKSIPFAEQDKTLLFGTSSVKEISGMLEDAGASGILVDARHAGNAAASCDKADIEEYLAFCKASKLPITLAGGITPENVADMLKKSKATGIDIMTGIEDAPGVKSKEKLERLFKALNDIVFNSER